MPLRILPLFAVLVAFVASMQARADGPDFERVVAPLLAKRCLECHGPGEKKGELDLTRRESALRGGESGAALVPGKPDESPLWRRIADNEMPPKHPLNEAERRIVREWIASGAAWSATPIDPLKYSSDRRAGYDWWSLQPLRASRPAAAAVPRASLLRGPIDEFIQAKLSERDLAPSPEASRAVLLRRAAFDLLGLPPTAPDLEEFVTDERPDAFERQVDRMLASPSLGERWARHWLDVAHFGESDGFEYDRLRPNAWPYRDWVINALNQDLPYDQFVRLQVAGDVLRPDDPQAVVATGFLVGGAFDGLMPAGDVMRQIMRQDELEDLVGIVGQTFLGLTVQCGRCHDHKFDPMRQSEYYSLASALSGVKRGERSIPLSPGNSPAAVRIETLERELREIEEPARRAAMEKRRAEAGGTTTAANHDANGKNTARPSKLVQPIAAWNFTRDLRDQIGNLHGQPHGGARVTEQGLELNGTRAYVTTAPLDRPLRAKTLTAVVKLANLTQRGGGVISVQTSDGQTFDAIVFGEQEPGRWMSGSNFFQRTQSFQAPAETEAERRPVHVAIVYEADGTIRGFVDGRPYGKSYGSQLQAFAAGQAQVVFGLRHAPPGGNRMLAGTIVRAALYDRALSNEEVAAAAAATTDYVSDQELAAQLTPVQSARRGVVIAQLAALRDLKVRGESGKVFAVTPQAAAVTRVLLRGNPLQPADTVAPGGIGSIVGLNPQFGLAPDSPDAERRQRLADWLTDGRNPLFARTIVNRIWHYHFGAGLVLTPNDLGFSGGEPTHPELLDWLALSFQQSGYSWKRLHRDLVTATVYRQTSTPRREAEAMDADNRLLWRMNVRRLEAESVRDAMLSVAGQLNRQIGGPGYQDFRPFLRGGTQFYEPLDPVGGPSQRRSVYRTWARGGHNRLLDTFDCPDPSTSTPRRSVTTTPLQALALLNNSFVLRIADQLADDVRRTAGDDLDAQLRELFGRTLGRPVREAEREAVRPVLERHGLAAVARVLLNSNAFVYVD